MKTSGQRWVVLGAFSLAAALSQMLWLNFAPLLTQIQSKYGVSETQASLLILVFPLIYVFLSIPAGWLVDKRGYVFSVGIGAILMAAFASLRILDEKFWVLLVAQIGIAVAQPFVINGISKLVLDWFSKEQGALATGLGTVGMFVGMAGGLALTPALVDSTGFRGAMIFFAIISIVICALTLALCRSNSERRIESDHRGLPTFIQLLRNRDLILIYFMSFVGLGFFNGLTTWLEKILAPRGINSVQAGLIGGALIVGGILGAAIIPSLSDHFRTRKPFLIGSIAVTSAIFYALCEAGKFNLLLVLGGILGFFFLPAFSILLEMCSELVGESHAGEATGILMLTGNAGGVVVVMAMEWVKGDGKDFQPAIQLLLALLSVAILTAFAVRETHHLRRRPGPL